MTRYFHDYKWLSLLMILVNDNSHFSWPHYMYVDAILYKFM